uniref:GTPase HflX n=1 Tax=Lygus hesperus TaxID=30085 RepID=A0A0A9XS08_LYGHE
MEEGELAHEDGPAKEAPDNHHLELGKNNEQKSRMSSIERQLRKDLMHVIDGRLRLIEQRIEQHQKETKEMFTQLLESFQDKQTNIPHYPVEEQPHVRSGNIPDTQRPWLKLRLQRFDNRLTQDSDYTLWRDKIRAEILANDCLCVFEKNGKSRGLYSSEDLDSMKYCVRSFIIGHLGPFHHSLVQYTDDPIEMMVLLDQAGQPLSKFGEYELQDKLNHLKFEPSRESVLEFMKRFEDLVVQLRRFITLTEDQAKRSLILAIKQALPSVYNKESNAPAPGLTVSEIKRLMFDEENLSKEERRRATESNAMLTNTTQKSFSFKKRVGGDSFNKGAPSHVLFSKQGPCKKCGVNGHSSESCTNKGWKCYACQKFTTSHYSKNCPYKESSVPGQTHSNNAQKKAKAMKRLGKPGIDKHKGMKRVPLWKAKKAISAIKHKGHANLTIQADSDTEDLPEAQRCVWVNSDEFDYDATEILYADASDSTSDTALACFDGRLH